MKICITAQGSDPASDIDPRFGRCQYFIFIDPATLEFEAVENPGVNAMGGAGVQSAQLVAGKEAKAVFTGNVGPNAFRTLQAAVIDVFVGVSGTVKEALEKYNEGGLKPAEGPSVDLKAGQP